MLPVQSEATNITSVVPWYATDRLTRLVLSPGSSVYIAEATPSLCEILPQDALRRFRLSQLELVLYRLAFPFETTVSGNASDFRGHPSPQVAFMRICRKFKRRYPRLALTLLHDGTHSYEFVLMATHNGESFILARMGAVYEYKPFERFLHQVMSSRCEDFSWSQVPPFAQLVLLQALSTTPGYLYLDRSDGPYCMTVLRDDQYCFRLPKRFQLIGACEVVQLCVCSECETVTSY